MIPNLTWRQEQDGFRNNEGANSDDLKEHLGQFVSSQISNIGSLFSKFRKHAEEDVTSLEANVSSQEEKQSAENSKFWSPADLQHEGPQMQQTQTPSYQMTWGGAGSRDVSCSLPRRHMPYPRHEATRFDSCAVSRSPRRGDSSPTSPSRFPFARRSVCWPPPSRLCDDAMNSPTAPFASRQSLAFQPPPPLAPPAPTSSSYPSHPQQQVVVPTAPHAPAQLLPSTPTCALPSPSQYAASTGHDQALASQSPLLGSGEAAPVLPAVTVAAPPQPVPSPARLEEEDP
mmetsp:Transcript_89762/g.239842  ORF Transcript_89762/g.239842 Transcript_89762/m.239842 type:complete len:286 (+) Transcript_89762:172-1029(+)|eukprot:CAMPEP_0113672310 /NCGR_PEP_ID=MMETSP0038_2-20120614/6189_1 /TAXON_ID=2898 /ORGANISM="Cryptomonas paramecium" /LENGTH=285 /DNA_ID=CAMNT_0000588559 /DNA_START=103 /DNA_END=960 /DNA_ORIENTATION=+ /assembly_acc=CAM_ASM_000170